MTSRIATVLIAVAWLAMTVGLIRDEVAPALEHAREIAESASYADLDRFVPESSVEQMGIYMGSRRIGTSTTWLRRKEDELVIESETHLNLLSGTGLPTIVPGAGGGVEAMIHFRALVIGSRLIDFRTTVSAPPGSAPAVTVDGAPRGDSLILHIKQFGAERTEVVPFDQRQFLASSMAPGYSYQELEVGRRWRIKALDYFNYSVSSAWAEVTGKERITIQGEEREAFVVEIEYGTHKVTVWVDESGQLLQQKLLAFTFIREEPSEEALEALRR